VQGRERVLAVEEAEGAALGHVHREHVRIGGGGGGGGAAGGVDQEAGAAALVPTNTGNEGDGMSTEEAEGYPSVACIVNRKIRGGERLEPPPSYPYLEHKAGKGCWWRNDMGRRPH
jgi:hypothetical protein